LAAVTLGCVVLTHEPTTAVIDTIDALRRSATVIDELIVVDNNSSENAFRMLSEIEPTIDVERLPSNDGYGIGMNHGAARLHAAGCATLLFLTQETVVDVDAIGHLAAALAAGAGVVGPILCRQSAPEQVWSAGGSLRGIRRAPTHDGIGRPLTAENRSTRSVEWLDGACLMLTAETFAAVGGFRTDLFLYWEDVDLCRRIARTGLAVKCVGAAVAHQEPAMTPPYLNARNRALVLGPAGQVGSIADIVRHTVVDLIRGRGMRRAGLETRGLRDARHGVIDRSIALERPT
jgi:GT2 family glycosyltransferase